MIETKISIETWPSLRTVRDAPTHVSQMQRKRMASSAQVIERFRIKREKTLIPPTRTMPKKNTKHANSVIWSTILSTFKKVLTILFKVSLLIRNIRGRKTPYILFLAISILLMYRS